MTHENPVQHHHGQPMPQEVTPPDSPQSIHHQLSSLAVLHQVRFYPGDNLIKPDGSPDKTNGLYLDRVELDQLPNNHTVEDAWGGGTHWMAYERSDSQGKRQVLHALRDTILSEAKSKGEARPEEADWRQLSDDLLEKLPDATPQEKDALIVASVVAANFSPQPEDRESFLRKVYGKNLQEDFADACSKSPVVILLAGPNAPGATDNDEWRHATSVYPVKQFGRLFSIEPERMQKYLAAIHGEKPESGQPSRSVKKVQKDFMDQKQVGEADAELQGEAENVVLQGEKVQETLLDIHKIERFALQQEFIHEQRKHVLPGPDYANSPLAQQLAACRSQNNAIHPQAVYSDVQLSLEQAVGDLQGDVQSSFTALSEPVVQEFSLPQQIDTQDMGSLTRSQWAALRFRTLREYGFQHAALGHFIDAENFVQRRERQPIQRPDDEIWSASEDGAAVPIIAATALEAFMTAANQPDAPEATADELAKLMHANRYVLLGAATQHFEELSTASDIKIKSLYRDEHGKLQMQLKTTIPSKGSLDVYSAETLGCPALREIDENRRFMTFVEKASYGSANYIDHALAAIINEAKARGIFDIGRYPLQVPQVSHPVVQSETVDQI